ncbi:MAG TPA: C10 family peptidase [Bacteroidales bacterium]|nr:C10 family peptidase [Bacteroidales bacterium]HSA44106.1 C10 family peptidase [Bacteroidales bacterium]
MKRITTVFLALLLLSGLLTARPVDHHQAMQVAKNFYYERISQFTEVSYDDISLSGAFQRVEDGRFIYRVFTVNLGGYVIISGDDAVSPVIAYSFWSEYGTQDEPPQFTSWMDNVRDQIVYHIERKSAPTAEILADWQRLTGDEPGQLRPLKGERAVKPLLISKWNQGAYYNELCPADPDGPGGHVYAGCVATAMAQVMYYYRFPASGQGSHTHYSSYGPLTANFANTTYQWDAMLPSIQSTNTAIATLLLHCGIAVDMGYSPTGSGAYSNDAADAMVNYFRYDPATQMVSKSNYSNTAWANLLRDQLDDRKPMYYHGYGSGGHAFNVDGYQDDFFHFNWGWSGSYNGFFNLNNLNPGGSSFTNGQGAMINIYPTGNYPAYCTGFRTLTPLCGSFDDGSGPMDYQSNSDCYYLINPTVGPNDSVSHLIVRFQSLETENNADIVTVYDGPGTSSPVIGSFSGINIPQSITSSGNQVLIRFTSDNDNNNQGWFITYESKMPQYCQTLDTYTAANGILQDGSGTKNYNNKTICQYLIQPPNVQQITLNFTEFQTEPVSDFVEVYAYDTTNGSGTLLGKFFGSQLPPTLVSQTGAMFLIFYTNSSINAAGWKAVYTSQPAGITEDNELKVMQVYPNPASDMLFVTFETSESRTLEMEICNMQGQCLQRKALQADGSRLSVDISDLTAGLYQLILHSPSGKVSRRFVVQ